MLSRTPRFARVTLLLWHRCQVINRHLPWHGGATDCRSPNNSGRGETPSRSRQCFLFFSPAVELLNSCVVRQLLTTAILEIDWSAWDESLNEESILEVKTGREVGWGGQGRGKKRAEIFSSCSLISRLLRIWLREFLICDQPTVCEWVRVQIGTPPRTTWPSLTQQADQEIRPGAGTCSGNTRSNPV